MAGELSFLLHLQNCLPYGIFILKQDLYRVTAILHRFKKLFKDYLGIETPVNFLLLKEDRVPEDNCIEQRVDAS